MSAGNEARDGRVVFNGVEERSLKELGKYLGKWGDGQRVLTEVGGTLGGMRYSRYRKASSMRWADCLLL